MPSFTEQRLVWLSRVMSPAAGLAVAGSYPGSRIASRVITPRGVVSFGAMRAISFVAAGRKGTVATTSISRRAIRALFSPLARMTPPQGFFRNPWGVRGVRAR